MAPTSIAAALACVSALAITLIAARSTPFRLLTPASRIARGRATLGQFRGYRNQIPTAFPGKVNRCLRMGSTVAGQPETKAVELVPCPKTVWGTKDININDVVSSNEPLPEFPLEIDAKSLGLEASAEKSYFQENKDDIKKKLEKHGAVVLRNFELPKTPPGFRDMWENGLELTPCEDPLSSVAARPTVNAKDGVFEAVNKPSLNKYFVGMHNEMVGTQAPNKAAFVCFKAAEEGGEFLILNGQRMLRELDPNFLKRLYAKDMRYAVAQFPLGFLQNQPEFLSNLLKPVIKGVLDVAIKQKVNFYTESVWDTETNNGDLVLQVRAAANSPVIRHPATGEPVWFANIHSHSQKLRQMRADKYGGGDEGRGKTTGSSKINLTDVFYGDGTPISEEDLKMVADATMKSVLYIKMGQGDVVLVDNYKTQHGRNVFEGIRKHAVTWFE